MIFLQTKIITSDNSGIRSAKAIKIYSKNVGTLNDIMLISVKNLKFNTKIKKGDLFKAIIIRVKQKTQRHYGHSIKFLDNAVVVLNKKDELYGTRIFGPVASELRKKRFTKILSLASVII
jgi:large subunit ribosomal protein L14